MAYKLITTLCDTMVFLMLLIKMKLLKMNKLTVRFTILCLILGVGFSWGQSAKLAKANRKFENLAYIDAIEIYKELAKEGEASYDIYTKIADSYYFNSKYSDASQWYDKITQNYPSQVTGEQYFRFAQTLRATDEYDRADEMMNKFSEISGQDYRAELFKEKPDYVRVEGYRKSDYKIDMIRQINSRYSDFGPTYYKENQLIFASSRDTGVFAKRIHKWNNQPFLDFYISSMKEDGKLTPPQRFSKILNTKFHESTSTFSPDGNTVYFTRNNFTSKQYAASKNGINKLKIYRSRRGKEQWSEAEELPFNDDEWSTAHPTLSRNGKKLYFASDRPGTVGLSDIWVVDVMEDGTFSEPENLGRPINTEGRESFPFLSDSEILYFASDGHPGLGGFDIFVSAPSSEQVTVLSLGAPVNSPSDDFAFIVKDSAKTGFFSSSRKRGMGSDDIYQFEQEELPEPTCDVIITGVITDVNTGEVLPEATVQLLSLENEVLAETPVDAEGRYSFDVECSTRYIVRASERLYYDKEVVVTTTPKGSTIEEDLALELRLTEVNLGDDLAKILDLKPIYFDYDKSDIRPDAAIELTKIISAMKQVPSMVISARSHTDSRGRDSYNLSLSDRRAKSTVAYIISRGVEPSRITGQGYGETQLVNGCANGVKCSDEEHQLNRRSEFIVVSQ